jgi:hypothetical protein
MSQEFLNQKYNNNVYFLNSLSYLWRWEKKVIQTNLTNIIKEKQDNIRGIQFKHLIKDFKK